MPYTARKQRNGYASINKKTGRTIGHSKTKTKAKKAINALRRAGAFAQPRIQQHPTPFAAALGAWVAQAACRDHEPDMWYPPSRHSSFASRAIRICLDCPVIKECDKAIHSLPPHERWGIWAGKRYMG